MKLEAEDETLPEPTQLNKHSNLLFSATLSVEKDLALIAAQKNAETAQARSTAAKSVYFPVVSFNAQRKWTSNPGIGGQERSDSYFLLASWKFDFGVFSADASLQSLAHAARLRSDLARAQASAQLEELQDRQTFSLSSIQAADARIQANKIALNLTQKRFESGLSSLLELQEAQRDLLSAEVSRIQALAEYHQTQLELSLVQ